MVLCLRVWKLHTDKHNHPKLHLGSSECTELIGLLHYVGFPFGESCVSSQLVLDVLHGDLDSTSSLLTGSRFWLLVRFILVRAVVSCALWVL